ncbi:MAG: ATP-binding protein [Chloroflexota bacterium]
MAIHIDRLSVENVGPIGKCSLDFGHFNLVYGRNEQGKTLLVEFLIRALFKNQKGWTLRPTDCRGQVWVNGLSGDGALAFTPDSREKLEDHWNDALSGLPPRVSRLLVVKGAEVALDGSVAGGIDKQVLKELLSGHSVIDAIKGRMQKTVLGASIEDGAIIGDRRGRLKERLETQEEKKRLDDLLQRVNRLYSGGPRAVLRAEQQAVETKLAEMERARRHHAWQLAQRIEALEAQLSRLPQAELDDLRMDVRTFRRDVGQLRSKQRRLNDLQEKSEQYRWLQEATEVYEQRETAHSLQANSLWLVVAAAALVVGVLFVLLDVPALALPALLVAAATAAWYIRALRQEAQQAGAIDEVQRLEDEFERRFERPLSGLPLLRQRAQSLQDDHYEARTLEAQVQEAQEALQEQRADIAARLHKFTDEPGKPQEWADRVAALQEERERLEREKRGLATELQRLDVAPSDYRRQAAGVAFSQETLDTLREKLQQLQEKLEEEIRALDDLKHDICRQTDDEISINWQLLLHHLQEKHATVTGDYRQQTAGILARVLVCEVLDELRQDEDAKIRRHLRSPRIAVPLQAITNRYREVALDGQELYVSDTFGRFSLGDLSSGALEQVLLALRLGVATTLLDDQALFLILDDAFQYSDWQRRERLLQQMVVLANEGWQVIYFTMDDHIRRLFDDAGRNHFGDGYRSFDLAAVD